ncbi:MAG: hypothetical protein MJA83_05685 [Gammaproteobacteria bacterium]|nr:hypothetical protein [Gammaproteobacteria bacterium]
MKKPSVPRRKRRAANKVVPIRGKKGLKLTEEERLGLENCLLKIRIIQEEAQKNAAKFVARKEQLAAAIGKRLGIPMDAYNVNLETGDLVPVENQEAAPEGGSGDAQASKEEANKEGDKGQESQNATDQKSG